MTNEENLNTDENGNLDNIVLALLFSADEPVSIRKLASIVGDADGADVKAAVDRWTKLFADESWSIAIEKVAGGYQLSSRTEYAPFIARLYSGKRKFRLSRAALETLAIIAYKQPITRAEVETIRGVSAGGVVGNLMERNLIKITGKAKVLGAPFLYGTTQEFLEYLGLNSLRDLPSMEELEALLEKEAYGDSPQAEEGAASAETGAQPDEDGELLDDTDEDDTGAYDAGTAADADVPIPDTDEADYDDTESPADSRPAAGSAKLGTAIIDPMSPPVDAQDEDTSGEVQTPVTESVNVESDERDD